VSRYVEALGARGEALTGKRVLLFGYGGRFDVGIGLLEAGAAHVVLCEKYAPPDDEHNSTLLAAYPGYLEERDGKPRPRPERMTLLQADIREVQPSPEIPAFDYVFTSSVYEHLEDVDGITCALAALTKPGGLHVHYVDLRDHFFKYPFEMLTFSEKVWRGWLNPTSNHNRFRLRDYRRVFEKYFADVHIDVLERNEAAFERVRARVRGEFVTGNLQDDSVTLILVTASRPKPMPE
jgi:SAM-dependent methyltransferase